MSSTPKVQSDREDGEIIEDEFEDISDNSITLTSSGKCISPKDHLPDISLSSVSEDEDKKIKQRRFHPTKRKRTHRKRNRSYRKSISVDSDSDEYVELDRKLLRAAIHIDNQDSLRNSLHTRLKAMIKPDSNSNTTESKKPNTHQETENVSSDDGDDDLIQLRLEALRTAVLNKFKHRKKIKCKEISESDGFEGLFSDVSYKAENKENSVVSSKDNAIVQNVNSNAELTSENQRNTDSDSQNNASQDEDEDVLRALLLASLSKKISDENIQNVKLAETKNIYSSINAVPQNIQNSNKIYSFNKNTMHKKIIPLKHSQVQPIIININCDSDTDEEFHDKASQVVPADIPKTIENSVDKFLKEQRAKVEAENCKNEEIRSDLFNKSSVKLLPKTKQIEYQNLLKKLHDAKVMKQRQNLKQVSKLKPKLQQNFNFSKKKCEQLIAKNAHANINLKNVGPKISSHCLNSENIPDLRNEVKMLHKVLKGIQIQKSQRLQVQAQYTTLTPIVRKINEASIERKKYDKEINRLLDELTEAKNKLRETHINIATYVRELVAKKEEIDKKSKVKPNMATINTSTPLKDQNTNETTKQIDMPSEIKLDLINNSNVYKFEKTEESGEQMKSSVLNDRICSSAATGVVPKYVSPLDSNERVESGDPFSVMCPYDIDGKCRDPDCSYKHYRNK